MNYTHLGSETVYHGKAFDVLRSRYHLPNDQTRTFDIVAHQGAVTLVPVDAEGRIYFVRQYRPATGQMLLELPAGTLEKDEPPEACAAREIREETGMAAKELQKLGEFFLAPGYSTEYMHVYLARDLYPSPLSPDADEFLQNEMIPAEHAYQMAEKGEFLDGKTLAALLLARPFLGKI